MGSVPPIYTKGDTIYYSDVVAGAPRDWSRTRCGLVEAQEGAGEVRLFGVPQRGTAYQPGVKPRVGRTTGAF
jgi:hypothetical protein